MIDLFGKLFATMKASTYYGTTLAGFKNANDEVKIYEGDDSPTTETPFVSIEINPGKQGRLTNWQGQIVFFHFTGTDRDVALLWTMANETYDLFVGSTAFSDGTIYEVIGDPDFSKINTNPVTENKILTLALRFGMAE